MHDLYNLKDMLVEALADYGRRDTLTQSSVQMIDTLAHAAKNVCKVIESDGSNEYSFKRGRDRMGRYTSRDGSEMAYKLREMMGDTDDDVLRAEIGRLADKMERF